MGNERQTRAPAERRVWFITGTSSGLGRGIAQAVIDHGDYVAATARRVTAVADLASQAPGRVHALDLDVTKTQSITAAVEQAQAQFGRIDVLVNNAGYGLLGAFEELAEDDLRQQFETNLFGPMAVTRAILPSMRQRRSGHVVQISSVNGVVPGPGGSAYVGSKFAFEGMSEALAAEVAHLGIHVTIVEPGPFRTDFSGRSLHWAEPMDDYSALIAPAREAFEASHGSQPGDPYRAGRAIIEAVGQQDPPLRLPLGAESFSWIRDYLHRRLVQLDAIEEYGADTAFEGIAETHTQVSG
jgi:NAD(P)-dependent dehydrogenase (short-subunit alcohol dehydrogenase family)